MDNLPGPGPSSSNASLRSKARSKACLHCRRRKMRCDGVRPACFQCIRADRSTECEYGDDSRKSDTQMLYERLSSLEKRYRDLQALKSPRRNGSNGRSQGATRGRAQLSRSNSMPGHDRPIRSRRPTRGDGEHASEHKAKASISAHSSPLTRSDSPHSDLSDGSYRQASFARTNDIFLGGLNDVQSSDELSQGFSDQPAELPFGLSQVDASRLLAVFASHSQQAGISLVMDCQSFNCGRFPKAFMPLFFLWAIHFSKDAELQQHKAEFLDLTLDSLSGLLRDPLGAQGGDPKHAESIYNLLIAILIHTSLATYFFAHGRMLEGNYHSNNASQLAICAGLHRTISPMAYHAPARDGEASHNAPGAGLLPKPRSLKDAVFRQFQFWNTFVLDRSWSTVSGAPSPSWRWGSAGLGLMSSEGVLNERSARTAIKTSWPEDNAAYSNVNITLQIPSEQPVEDFLAGTDQQPSSSILTLRAKGAALFEASSRLSSFTSSTPCQTTCDTLRSFQNTLSNFLLNLPALPSSNTMQPVSFEKSSLITTYTMTHAAIIRINAAAARRAIEGQSDVRLQSYTDATDVVADTLKSYERMLGNSPISLSGSVGVDYNYNNNTHVSSLVSTVEPTGAAAGKAVAAGEICLASAREIIRITGCLGPADYEYCEPIIACCWELASQVLLQEIRSLGLTGSHLSHFQQLLSELGTVENALRHLGETFPISKSNADKLTSQLRKIINAPTSFV